MPLISPPGYHTDFLHRITTVATIGPTLWRRVALPAPRRERMITDDEDFIDLDCWWREGAADTVVLCHGLEGNAQRQYMLGMARAFSRRGWNVVGYNYRGCSGEPNRQPFSYHSGATDDLRQVLARVQRPGKTLRALIGFSLGGNLVLKYLAEDPAAVPTTLCAAVAFCAPIDLAATARQLALPRNWFYQRRFLKKLEKKIRAKAQLRPGSIDPVFLKKIKTLRDFDEAYTAPLSGFASADDYYHRASAGPLLPRISIPTLLVSAQDDPFLAPPSYPLATAQASPHFHLEIPPHGGHVGFYQPGGEYWSEQRAVQFITGNLPA